MTTEQTKVKNGVARLEKRSKALSEEIAYLENKLKAKQRKMGQVSGEICRLRSVCEHVYCMDVPGSRLIICNICNNKTDLLFLLRHK